jgi:hypothetical protein
MSAKLFSLKIPIFSQEVAATPEQKVCRKEKVRLC